MALREFLQPYHPRYLDGWLHALQFSDCCVWVAVDWEVNKIPCNTKYEVRGKDYTSIEQLQKGYYPEEFPQIMKTSGGGGWRENRFYMKWLIFCVSAYLYDVK